MLVSLIAILTKNNVIGRENTIPWYFDMDMYWFKKNTLYKPIIMGRKTFESLGKKPMPNRLNIVLSTRLSCIQFNNVIIANTPDHALSLAKRSAEVIIVGGSLAYSAFIDQCSRMYLTYIDLVYDYGDVWFPNYDQSQWKIVFEVYTKNYMYNARCFNLIFKILERICM